MAFIKSRVDRNVSRRKSLAKNEAFSTQDTKPYVTIEKHSLQLVTTMTGNYYESEVTVDVQASLYQVIKKYVTK